MWRRTQPNRTGIDKVSKTPTQMTRQRGRRGAVFGESRPANNQALARCAPVRPNRQWPPAARRYSKPRRRHAAGCGRELGLDIIGDQEQIEIVRINRPFLGELQQELLKRAPVGGPDQDNWKIGDFAASESA